MDNENQTHHCAGNSYIDWFPVLDINKEKHYLQKQNSELWYSYFIYTDSLWNLPMISCGKAEEKKPLHLIQQVVQLLFSRFSWGLSSVVKIGRHLVFLPQKCQDRMFSEFCVSPWTYTESWFRYFKINDSLGFYKCCNSFPASSALPSSKMIAVWMNWLNYDLVSRVCVVLYD